MTTALHRAATCAVALVAVAAGVVGLLAWDTKKYRGPDGYLHGPYSPWQVWCLVAVVLVVAVFVGLRSEWLTGAVSSALGGVLGAVVVGFTANGSEGSFVGTFVGALWGFPALSVLLVAGTVYAVRTRQWRTARYRRTV